MATKQTENKPGTKPNAGGNGAEPHTPEQKKAAAGTPLRKINIKDVTGGVDGDLVKKLLANPDMVVPLMEVYGISSRMKPGVSEYGDFVRFVGQFRAKNIATGEIFRAPALLLPKFLEDELAGGMAGGPDGDTVTAEFAVRIGVQASRKFLKDGKGTAYEYTADALVPPQESNAMAALEARIAATPALPAPK